jgi:hypothetical protein
MGIIFHLLLLFIHPLKIPKNVTTNEAAIIAAATAMNFELLFI